MERHPTLLDRATSVLVVVDMQDPFLNVMYAREPLVANVVLLCKAAALLEIPVILTTQNAARMGSVTPVVAHAAHGVALSVVDKMCFSCAQSEPFAQTLTGLGRKQVVICGVETHICVSQTAHDLRYAGYQVHVCPDAVSSRTVEKHKLGMERIRDAGILPCAAEAVVYEWLREAGTPEFRELLTLVR
ncbi:MAG: isochorismatase family protein [Armatimonadetes bacterium]|nr:isochorismatase family protein [Armatimonadota bacterium]